MFTLKKIKLLEDKDSAVYAGHTASGPSLIMFNYTDPDTKKVVSKVSDVEAGWQLLLTGPRDFLRTSQISEIISKTEDKVTFKTQTSVYELTQ